VGSARLCVALEASEVEQHAGFVADDPRVVSGWHVECVAGPELALGAVVHPQCHAALQDVADVLDLTGVGPGDRLDVLRPAPARLEGSAADGVAVEIHELYTSLVVGEFAHFVWAFELLPNELRHVTHPLFVAVIVDPIAPNFAALRRVSANADRA